MTTERRGGAGNFAADPARALRRAAKAALPAAATLNIAPIARARQAVRADLSAAGVLNPKFN